MSWDRVANYQARKSCGQCVNCSNDAVLGLVTCQSCREKDAARNTVRSRTPEFQEQRRVYFKKLFSDPGVKNRYSVVRKAGKRKLKLETFQAYGGAKCACCGESALEFLTLDHVYRDGHKEEGKRGGHSFYRELRKVGFPDKDRYQVLCYNCNCGREHTNGVCPHQQEVDDGRRDNHNADAGARIQGNRVLQFAGRSW